MKKDNERKILRLLRNMEETTDKIFEVLHRIELKFIDDDSYKLIVRNNYGILIMWIGLFISSISFIPRLKKRV